MSRSRGKLTERKHFDCFNPNLFQSLSVLPCKTYCEVGQLEATSNISFSRERTYINVIRRLTITFIALFETNCE